MMIGKQFCQFDIHEAHLFTAICGMDCLVDHIWWLLHFLQKGCVLICPTGSRRLNASTVQLVGGQLLLIVYFSTDDGTSSSKDNLSEELEGLLIAQRVDYLLLVIVILPFLPRCSIFTKMFHFYQDVPFLLRCCLILITR